MSLQEIEYRTNCFQAFLKPTQSNNNHEDVDESQIPKDRNEVNVDLLIGLQGLDIDPSFF